MSELDQIGISAEDQQQLENTGKGQSLYEKEVADYEQEKSEAKLWDERELRLRLFALERKQLKQILKARKDYASRIYWLVTVWLIGILLVIVVAGFRPWGFELSEKVLITIIGGTTVNVLGIFTIVANFLFPKSQVRLGNNKLPGLDELRKALKKYSTRSKGGRHNRMGGGGDTI